MTCRETLTNIYNKLVAGINLLNIAGVKINPATEDTLQDIRAKTNKLTFDDSNQLKIAGIADLSLGTVQLEDTTNIKVNPATHEDMVSLIDAIENMPGGEGGGGDALYPYYTAGDESSLDQTGVTIDPTFKINKIMIGNVGTETITFTIYIDTEGDEVYVPGGGSFEMSTADADHIKLYGSGAGHAIYVVQGSEMKSS